MTALPIRSMPPMGIHLLSDQDTIEPPECPKTKITIESEHEVADAVLDLLKDNCPDLFQRSGELVRIIFTPSAGGHGTGSVGMKEVDQWWLREQIATYASFEVPTKDGPRKTLVPTWLSQILLARRMYTDIRPLAAVVETPVFLSSGRVLDTPGYDPESCLYLASRTPPSPIPAHPTRKDAVRALTDLVDAVQDFPFSFNPSPESHCAAWLAWLFTATGRYAIYGPVPFLLIDACSPGSGKGFLAQLGGLIATGHGPTPVPCSSDQEELRRTLLPQLRGGARIGWIDEISPPFGGRAWNAMLCAYPNYTDRVIQTSSCPSVLNLITWVATGNNASLTPDTIRRTLVVRLEPDEERPETRTDFAQADLLGWAAEHQPRLLAAALTILRAFHLAGRPRVIPEPLGGFERWDELVRQCVAWITGVDPIATMTAAKTSLDPRAQAWRHVLDALNETFNVKTFTAADAVRELLSGPQAEGIREDLSVLAPGHEPTPRSFSTQVLSTHRGAVAGGLRLNVANPHTKRGTLYQVRQVGDRAKVGQG